MTQYERDFERVSATVRKEVIRFEVWLFVPVVLSSGSENICCRSLTKLFLFNLAEREGQEFQKTDHHIFGVSASVSATGECVADLGHRKLFLFSKFVAYWFDMFHIADS